MIQSNRFLASANLSEHDSGEGRRNVRPGHSQEARSSGVARWVGPTRQS